MTNKKKNFFLNKERFELVGRVVEWFKPHAYDQHGFGSKPTRAILLCSCKRHLMAVVLNRRFALAFLPVRNNLF